MTDIRQYTVQPPPSQGEMGKHIREGIFAEGGNVLIKLLAGTRGAKHTSQSHCLTKIDG